MDYSMLLKAFIVGGLLCTIAQIFIDKTKFTPAKILVSYVTIGCGATVPLTGFGNLLSKGAISKVQTDGFIGAFIGGTANAAGGIAAAIFFGYIASLVSKPKIKKQ